MASTFKDLCARNTWPEIEKAWLSYYRGKEDWVETLSNIIQELSSLEPIKPDWDIQLDTELDEKGGDWITVSGYTPGDPDAAGGIEYCDWKEWIGAEIDSTTLANYSEPEIIAHCLYEMTWGGFSREEVIRSRVFPASKVRTLSSFFLMDTWDYNYPTQGVYHERETRS
jgi:hypothetical protein